MQNSDSGTKANEAAQVREYLGGAEGYRLMYQARALNPGDRVRIKHKPSPDRRLPDGCGSRELDGLAGTVKERAFRYGVACFRVATDGGGQAWYEADELSPIVTDADGCEVGGPAAPRPPSEHRSQVTMSDAAAGALAVIVAELGAGWTALAEAQGWHGAALLARGELDAARDALRVVQGEADALRGKLEAAEAEAREVACDRAARRDEQARDAEAVRMLMAKLAAERSIHETAAIGADKLARQLAAVAQAWGTLRAWMLALPRPLGAAGIEGVDAVDKALGGVAGQGPCQVV